MFKNKLFTNSLMAKWFCYEMYAQHVDKNILGSKLKCFAWLIMKYSMTT